MDLKDSKLWKISMVEKMDALDKSEAWDLVELSVGRKLLEANGCLRRSWMQKVR